ncbi:DNA-binding response regulator, OmpR family, contains REC and winged-helix (wHTH) domain [Pseudarcicella hirudinis]|uniref:DNA-binding response regulator, OmpR family, contains REC and winged-helix (WHTH) domain n=1 Tax=Pseudarcicella hirudinis TaxID=1079859 RepID=A0A1I5MRD0_9BACT|nr:response regulator transcription factor [Pseudarcicella hirudinis]SFP11506.1 DNA-binding response regulator, OmpR family, contains REC and winged-helix (wHTH) domain [Pseudarcicella hirudinis]
MELKSKILLIEDDNRISETIVRGLVKNNFDVRAAFDGLIGLRMAISGNYDLIILDINLPLINGFEVCRNIREKKPFLPVLMLTAFGEIEDKIEGLEKGADDYLVKPFDFRELIARINALLRRAGQEPNKEGANILKVSDLEMNIDTKDVRRNGNHIDLTAKEFMLLEFLLKNKGKVLSKMDIAEKVWDLNFDTGTNIVEVYINYLRKKIDRDFEQKLIHTKTGLGYVLKDEV